MKKLSLIILITLLWTLCFGQEVISYNGSGNYILIEKTDLRRYDNGKYTGLVSREVSSFISPVSYDNGYLYEGNFFVWQDTVRNSRSVMEGFDGAIPAVFKISDDGVLKMIEDHGFPSFRSFPTYSVNKIKKGDKWQAKAERAVDPLGKGIVTKMPIVVEYQYLNDGDFHGEPCYLLSAQWATRYGMGSGTYHIDWGGDKDLTKATGSHKATIYVSKITGNALVIRDTVDETFIYADGNQIQFKGTISQFTEYPPAIDRSKIINALKRIAEVDDSMEEKVAFTKQDSSEEKNKTDSNNSADKENSAARKDGETLEKQDAGASRGLESGTGNERYADGLGSGDKEKQIAEGSNNKTKTTDIEKLIADKEKLASADKSYKSEKTEKTEKKSLVTVDNTPAGIRLTIPNLQFKPDSAELLNAEKDRLDKIAEVLKEVPECRLLIEGHTAATGRDAGELQLSKERAQAICNALVARGVSADRIICKGSGGKKPIADNSTPEGKAKNRRVEITILD